MRQQCDMQLLRALGVVTLGVTAAGRFGCVQKGTWHVLDVLGRVKVMGPKCAHMLCRVSSMVTSLSASRQPQWTYKSDSAGSSSQSVKYQLIQIEHGK